MHASPRMSIKRLSAKFVSYDEQKSQLMKILKVIAKLVHDGDTKVLVLSEATLDEYSRTS